MALATRCPNCHALFRVVADQLKLRGGLVRCGACRHVFDAIGTLHYIDDAVLSAPVPAPAATIGGGRPGAKSGGGDDLGVAAAVTAVIPAGPAAKAPAEQGADSSLADAGSDETSPEVAPLADSAATEPPTNTGRNWADEDQAEPAAAGDEGALDQDGAEAATQLDDAVPAPAFLNENATRRKRGRSILFGGGAVVLLLLALAQFAVLYRTEILARLPEARPALSGLCRVFGCSVGWPMRGDLLAVVGSELQALPGTSAFELTAVVRNRGRFTLALPAVELTLTDTMNRAVARKVFAPADYLTAETDANARLLAGIESGADLTIRVAFEARGVNAVGFVVYPFYF